ncbi:Retinol dehydrogenase 13-like [Oopsacas minuta]|uniref:Retinol dehydrogenase 13-like n=1 Tax=Oopsacas minuta TaxID=111878 RepID=A0AAV7JWA2_9METZ|nr:Retinol dehydrogenase 13-like [Oopsacas minuta]
MVTIQTVCIIEIILFFIFPLILLIPIPTLWLSIVPASSILHFLFYGHIFDMFNIRRKCPGVRLDGKTVIVTGGNSGIGYATALDLAKRGARVIIGCRNEARGSEAERNLRTESSSELIFFRQIDLGSMASIKEFSQKLLSEEARIDILINNAGLLSDTPEDTVDGFELAFGVNHLGPFYLTHLLLNRIKESAPSRIINVSSMFHKIGTPYLTPENVRRGNGCGISHNYAKSKLASVLFTVELAERLRLSGVETYSVHPGFVQTNISSATRDTSLSGMFLDTPTQGAKTSIYCAVSDKVLGKSGKYFANSSEGYLFWFVNKTTARKLWIMSEDMLGIDTNEV